MISNGSQNTAIGYSAGYATIGNPSISLDNGTDVDELKEKLARLEALFFQKVVVKCPACGQWGAAMCECKYCGHPIDMGKIPDGIQAPPKQKNMSGQTFVENPYMTTTMNPIREVRLGESWGMQGSMGIQGAQGVQGECGIMIADNKDVENTKLKKEVNKWARWLHR